MSGPGHACDIVSVVAAVVVGVAVALVVHVIGQAVAGKALGGTLTLARGWPGLRLVVHLPSGGGRELEAAFLLAGAMANLGTALALFSTSNATMQLVGVVQLVWIAVNLLPVGQSDGARLWALRRRA